MIDLEALGDRVGPLSVAERRSLIDTLDRIAGRLAAAEPLCADMIRMARDALAQPSMQLDREGPPLQ